MRIIGGTARGRKIASPPDRSIRPALDRLREAIFTILAARVEGAWVLDLFSGVGAFGLEALSRGARHATFVDLSRRSAALVEKNLFLLGFQRQGTVIQGDALARPRPDEIERAFDLVFVDPPFRLFGDERGAARIFERTAELISSSATTEDALVVLRLPSSYRGEVPFPRADLRRWGASRVVFLERT